MRTGTAAGCMWWWSVAIQLRKYAETATEPTAVIFFHVPTSSCGGARAGRGVDDRDRVLVERRVEGVPGLDAGAGHARRPGAVYRAAASLNIAAASRLGARRPAPVSGGWPAEKRSGASNGFQETPWAASQQVQARGGSRRAATWHPRTGARGWDKARVGPPRAHAKQEQISARAPPRPTAQHQKNPRRAQPGRGRLRRQGGQAARPGRPGGSGSARTPRKSSPTGREAAVSGERMAAIWPWHAGWFSVD